MPYCFCLSRSLISCCFPRVGCRNLCRCCSGLSLVHVYTLRVLDVRRVGLTGLLLLACVLYMCLFVSFIFHGLFQKVVSVVLVVALFVLVSSFELDVIFLFLFVG